MARGRQARALKVPPVEPTPEQARRGTFQLSDIVDKAKGNVTVTIGKAYRRVPMIDTLFDQKLFTESEYKALKHYRHHADIADKSPLRDSLLNLGRISTGSGHGPTIATLNAIRVRDDCERAAGSLVDILRAVVVDDMSLTQWCISRGNSVEKCRERKKGRVCAIEATEGALRIAQLEIKMVARWVEAELAA